MHGLAILVNQLMLSIVVSTDLQGGSMRKLIALLVLCSMTIPAFAGGVSIKAKYSGGTSAINEGQKGHISVIGDGLSFTHDGQILTIPWENITTIEYSKEVRRNVGAAVVGTLLLGPIGLVSLLGKKHKNYITVTYGDEVAVFLIEDKNTYRGVLSSLKAKTKLPINCSGDEKMQAEHKGLCN